MTETRLNDRAVIRLSATEASEDVRQFLQGLVTQDMATVAARRAAMVGIAHRARESAV